MHHCISDEHAFKNIHSSLFYNPNILSKNQSLKETHTVQKISDFVLQISKLQTLMEKHKRIRILTTIPQKGGCVSSTNFPGVRTQ